MFSHGFQLASPFFEDLQLAEAQQGLSGPPRTVEQFQTADEAVASVETDLSVPWSMNHSARVSTHFKHMSNKCQTQQTAIFVFLLPQQSFRTSAFHH